MYRLLIVDDEEIITDGLFEVFNQLIPDKLDVYKAYSAKEALEWLSRTRIDIVLTDIRMPGMSGLEMSEEIRMYWPRCKIVFLTGFSEFNYAYQAIQMPNVRYLLKMEGYDKIVETIREVIQEIDEAAMMSELLEKSQEQRIAMEHVAQGDYLRHLLQDSPTLASDIQELIRDFRKLNIDLSADCPVMLILGRLSYPEGTSYSDQSEILTSSRVIWNSYLSEVTRHTGITVKHGDLLWFLQLSPNAEVKYNEHLSRYLEGTLELIQESCRETLGLTIAYTVSGASCEWRDITRQFERLHQLQQMKIGDGISMLLIDRVNALAFDDVRDRTIRLNHRVENLAAHLEAGREERFFETFNEIANGIHACESLEQASEMYYTIALVLLSYVNRWYLLGQINNYGKLMRLDEHSSMKEGVQYLEKLAIRIFEVKKFDEKERSSDVIERICVHIQNHLGEDLSLVRLAELNYFNPSYLSRFFKQERGINLSEYIDNCRTVKAKELLKDEELKIREVALCVGYEAAHSFTRFFKKTTGMTPQEYREALHIHSDV